MGYVVKQRSSFTFTHMDKRIFSSIYYRIPPSLAAKPLLSGIKSLFGGSLWDSIGQSIPCNASTSLS